MSYGGCVDKVIIGDATEIQDFFKRVLKLKETCRQLVEDIRTLPAVQQELDEALLNIENLENSHKTADENRSKAMLKNNQLTRDLKVLTKTFEHVFKDSDASTEKCEKCGLNIRNEIHIRVKD
jgi:DNA repair ATPase RecN